MKPFPVVVYAAAAVCAKLDAVSRIAMGLSLATFLSLAATCAGPPQSIFVVSWGLARNAGIGPTQKMSDHVSRPFLTSRVIAWVTPLNDAVSKMPQLGPTMLSNGTGTPWVSSHTVSIAPAAPQTTWKSAARVTVANAASRIRFGEFATV